MSEISLTASMRSNLLSLQNTQSLMDMTQERLSTGKKVNSAIDNPSSYYTAQSLNNRANDLSALLDSMGQAVQTIKAADEAITSITSFAEQAKAVASSALDSSDAKEVESYMKQFNDIREQITQLAGDASYKGINLLNKDSLTVTFNESRTSHIVIRLPAGLLRKKPQMLRNMTQHQTRLSMKVIMSHSRWMVKKVCTEPRLILQLIREMAAMSLVSLTPTNLS